MLNHKSRADLRFCHVFSCFWGFTKISFTKLLSSAAKVPVSSMVSVQVEGEWHNRMPQKTPSSFCFWQKKLTYCFKACYKKKTGRGGKTGSKPLRRRQPIAAPLPIYFMPKWFPTHLFIKKDRAKSIQLLWIRVARKTNTLARSL